MRTFPASEKCWTAANLKPSLLLSLLPYQPITLGVGCLTLPFSLLLLLSWARQITTRIFKCPSFQESLSCLAWCVFSTCSCTSFGNCCTMTKKGWLMCFLLCHFSKFIMGAWKDLENQKKRRQARLKLGKMKKLKWQKWNSSDTIVQAVQLFFSLPCVIKDTFIIISNPWISF